MTKENGIRSLNGIAVCKFKTFSWDSGHNIRNCCWGCVSGTIAGSFELKQSKMAIHKEQTKDYLLGLFELLPKPQPR